MVTFYATKWEGRRSAVSDDSAVPLARSDGCAFGHSDRALNFARSSRDGQGDVAARKQSPGNSAGKTDSNMPLFKRVGFCRPKWT